MNVGSFSHDFWIILKHFWIDLGIFFEPVRSVFRFLFLFHHCCRRGRRCPHRCHRYSCHRRRLVLVVVFFLIFAIIVVDIDIVSFSTSFWPKIVLASLDASAVTFATAALVRFREAEAFAGIFSISLFRFLFPYILVSDFRTNEINIVLIKYFSLVPHWTVDR